MSDVEAGTGAGAPSAHTDSDLPVAEVSQLFVTLGKAFRAYQLYDENNPVRQRFVETLRGEFKRLWTRLPKLPLKVSEDHIHLGDSSVYRAESRADSLAFLFFKDGIREITLLPGIEGDELERFLGVLQKARKLSPEGDDLLTVLWEAQLEYFKYQFVNLLDEGVALPEPGPRNSPAELQQVLESEVEEDGDEGEEEDEEGGGEAQDKPQTVSKDDFNPTLYALDPREMQALQDELRKEMKRDLRGDVLSALFDRLEEPDNRERQSEILGILGTLLPNFLSRGALGPATKVLEELRKLEKAEGVFDDQRRAESSAILDEVSASGTVSEMIQALYDGTIRASPAQLGNFLQHLRGAALSPLLRASETVDHKELQAVLRKSVQSIAVRYKGAVLRLLEEDDPIVASGAARLAGDMQITEAGQALSGLLAHPVPDVRLAAVEAAITLRASTVASALEHTLDDPEREIRMAAARALAALRYRPAAKRLAGLLKSKEIRAADISEKVAFFEAYGVVAGDDAVALLDDLLNGKGFLGKREPAEVRAAAALGLGKIPDGAGRAALQKAAQDDDPVVRSSVNRALRNED